MSTLTVARFKLTGYVIPAMGFLLLAAGWPLGRALYVSLFNDPLTNPNAHRFVGVDNYVNVLTNAGWWQSVGWAFAVVVLVVTAQLLLGFVFAAVVNHLTRLAPIGRILLVLPFGLMAFSSASTWQAALDSGYLANWFRLDEFGERGALLTIYLGEVWRGTGIVAVILLVGMLRISPNLMTSAVADGATMRQRFTRIVLPAIAPAVAIAVVYRALDAFRMFDTPYLVGGLGAGINPPQTWLFETSLSRFEFGLGAAMSVVFFLISMLLGIALVRILRVRRAV